MLEENVRVEVLRLLHSLGFDAFHPPDGAFKNIGRPDIISVNPIGVSFVVEVKSLYDLKRKEPWIYVSEISDAQRRWMDRFTNRGGKAFIAFGTLTPGERKLWIIPWLYYLYDFELKQKFAKDIQINVSILNSLFSEYECEWTIIKDKSFPNSPWSLKSSHPLNTDSLFFHNPMKEEDNKPISYRFEEESKRYRKR